MKERNEILKQRNVIMEKMVTNRRGSSNEQENKIPTPNDFDAECIEYLIENDSDD